MAILDSIDTIREKAAEAAQAAARKTKQLAEIAKANVSIYSEEDKIKKAQQELGKLYYRDYVVGEDLDEAEYLPWCRQIDEAKQTIADLRDYIEELKSERVEMADEEKASEEDFADLEAVEEAGPEEAAEQEAAEVPAMEAVVCDDPSGEAPRTEE
ncbi:MAG: hypothetical protein PUA87_10380 [Oscillospiraceae bacterium]|nr:hypothetical protein [Oscillospiraceae bacterium]